MSVRDDLAWVVGAGRTTRLRLGRDQDCLHVVESLLAGQAVESREPLPPICGGAVGFLSYDAARRFEKLDLRRPPLSGVPDAFFVMPETVIEFDHRRQTLKIIALSPRCRPSPASAARISSRIDGILELLRNPVPIPPSRPTRPRRSPVADSPSRRGFLDSVREAKKFIREGDAFQVVLSRRRRSRTPAPPFDIYRALRRLNPSAYLFFLDSGPLQLIGSSPESLVKLQEGIATVRPIAGTRPRGATPEEDLALEAELIRDPKELAEHAMLVDLARNDLGRVCEPGTIQVAQAGAVERYTHVMHLASEVRGRLRADQSMFDLLRSSFPAGTVTGAPKIRAMQLVDRLEPAARGPYAGAVGYFGSEGCLDLCIAIRMLWMRGGAWTAQAGAGIVADSAPAREYEETGNKMRALLEAVRLAEGGALDPAR
jgi:anthranilate synthase component 1